MKLLIQKILIFLIWTPVMILWMGCLKSAFLYSEIGFIKYTNGLPTSTEIADGTSDKNGNIWIISKTDNVLYVKYFGKANFEAKWHQPANNAINSIYSDDQNDLWVGTQKGLYEKPNNSDEFIKFQLPGPYLYSISKITQSNDRRIWASTNGGLFRSTSSSPTGPFENFNPGIEIYRTVFFDIDVNKLDNSVWTVTYQKDFIVKTYFKNSLSSTFELRDKGLPAVGDKITLTTIFIDHNGGTWTGGPSQYLDGKGQLLKWNDSLSMYEKINITTSQGQPADVGVMCMFESKEFDLYVGTKKEGLYVKRNGQDNFTKVSLNLPVDPLNINTVFEDKLFKHDLWVGSGQGLYLQSAGIEFFINQNVNPIFYRELDKCWLVLNVSLDVNPDWNNIDKLLINGLTFTSGNVFILDGTNYQAANGKYIISTIDKSGKQIFYYVWIQDKINPEFIATDPNILDSYIGYINWEESRKYNVLHIYDPNNPETTPEISINVFKNDIFIDWNKTFYQEVDPVTFEPKGNKIFLTPNTILKLSTKGFYYIEICDQLGNKDVYYIQMGGAERIIPDKYVKPPEPEKFPVWAMVVLSILGVGTLGGGFGWIYYYWIGPKIAEAKNKAEDEDLKDSSNNGNDDIDSF